MPKSIRYVLRAFQAPFGGPLQIRRHVKALAESGFDARMVTDSLSDDHFNDLPVPTLLRSECAQELRSCVEMIRRGAREISDKLDQGQLTASYLDVSRMKTRVIEFWEGRV